MIYRAELVRSGALWYPYPRGRRGDDPMNVSRARARLGDLIPMKASEVATGTQVFD